MERNAAEEDEVDDVDDDDDDAESALLGEPCCCGCWDWGCGTDGAVIMAAEAPPVEVAVEGVVEGAAMMGR